MNPMDRVPVPPDPQPIQFSPVPVTTTVGTVETPDGSLVTLQCVTPLGVLVYFLSSEHARQLAGHLNQYATAAASGLQIIGNLGEPPAPNGSGS